MERGKHEFREREEMQEQRNNGFRVLRKSIVWKRVVKGKTRKQELNCNCESMQDFIASMPYHAIFGFLIPLLIDVLNANSGGTNKSTLFVNHSANMWTFLLATFIYCFAFAADVKFRLRNTNFSQLFGGVAVISGSLASVSLISIFLPCRNGPVIFIAWMILPVIVVYQQGFLIKNASNLLHRKIKKTISKFGGSNNSIEQLRVPV